MGFLLELGRGAEREAKDSGRNALAILFDKRSGGRRKWTGAWHKNPVDRLRTDARLLGSKLSSGKVYEVGALVRRFPAPADLSAPDSEGALVAEALVAYAKQILAHSDRDATKEMAASGLFPDLTPGSLHYRETHERLDSGLERLLLARELRNNGFDRWQDDTEEG